MKNLEPNAQKLNIEPKVQKLIVQKYGGATLADPEKIRAVALRLKEVHQSGQQVVAVVSAMGKTTNDLIALAQKVSPRPNRRELDMLLTTGERVSMALLSMALHDLGVDAISFTGSQAGILTDSSHVNAFILDVKAVRVEEALKKGKLVILAGFQGVNHDTKEITTLGRGGTDTTAVAMSAYLKADHCEILKDVPAVFTADPKQVPTAKKLPKLNYDQMLEMTFWGAKVLHYRCLELAKLKNMPLMIGSAENKNEEGTFVTNSETGDPMFESHQILALNSHEKVLILNCKGIDVTTAIPALQKAFAEKEISFPQLLSISKTNEGSKVLLTGPIEILVAIEKEFANDKMIVLEKGSWSSVTATTTGSSAPDTVQKILQATAAAKIQVVECLQSAMSTTVILASADRAKAISHLHELI